MKDEPRQAPKTMNERILEDAASSRKKFYETHAEVMREIAPAPNSPPDRASGDGGTLGDLTPCPHCGNTDIVRQLYSELHEMDDGPDGWLIVCDGSNGKPGCGASSGFHEQLEQSIAAWNMRALKSEPEPQQGDLAPTSSGALPDTTSRGTLDRIRAGVDAFDGLPADVVKMCKRRGWSMHWTHRGAYLHLESSELIEAIRGKHGDPMKEAADVLLVLMSITEYAGISWQAVLSQARTKCDDLMDRPRYTGEEYDQQATPLAVGHDASSEQQTNTQQRSDYSAPSLSGTPTEIEALVAEIDALEKKATPGEWAVSPDDRPGMHWNNHIVWADDRAMAICFMAHDNTPDNAALEASAHLIVALRNAWPLIRDALQTAQKPNSPNAVDAVRGALAELVRQEDLRFGGSMRTKIQALKEWREAWSAARLALEDK